MDRKGTLTRDAHNMCAYPSGPSRRRELGPQHLAYPVKLLLNVSNFAYVQHLLLLCRLRTRWSWASIRRAARRTTPAQWWCSCREGDQRRNGGGGAPAVRGGGAKGDQRGTHGRGVREAGA